MNDEEEFQRRERLTDALDGLYYGVRAANRFYVMGDREAFARSLKKTMDNATVIQQCLRETPGFLDPSKKQSLFYRSIKPYQRALLECANFAGACWDRLKRECRDDWDWGADDWHVDIEGDFRALDEVTDMSVEVRNRLRQLGLLI